MTGKSSPRSNIKGVAVFGLLGASMFVTQLAMSWLPNIEPVSLLVMVYTVIFGKRALYPIYVYVALECLIWGVNFWTINYIYIWAILAGLAWLMRKMDTPLGWAVLSGGFGLCFGLLCTPVYFAVEGWQFAFAWWVSGIPFDLLHGVGNFVMALALFRPCRKVLTHLAREVGLA